MGSWEIGGWGGASWTVFLKCKEWFCTFRPATHYEVNLTGTPDSEWLALGIWYFRNPHNAQQSELTAMRQVKFHSLAASERLAFSYPVFHLRFRDDKTIAVIVVPSIKSLQKEEEEK
jgi:hypothetical protein